LRIKVRFNEGNALFKLLLPEINFLYILSAKDKIRFKSSFVKCNHFKVKNIVVLQGLNYTRPRLQNAQKKYVMSSHMSRLLLYQFTGPPKASKKTLTIYRIILVGKPPGVHVTKTVEQQILNH